MRQIMAVLGILAGSFFYAETNGYDVKMGKVNSAQEIHKQNLLINADLAQPFVKGDQLGWIPACWLSGSIQNDRIRLQAEITKLIQVRIVDTDIGKVLELNRPIKLEEILGSSSTAARSAVRQVVRLANLNGGVCHLAFESRNEVIGKNPFAQLVMVKCYDGSHTRPARGKQLQKTISISIDNTSQWKKYSQAIQIPAGTRDLTVTIQADGCGVLQIRNLKVIME